MRSIAVVISRITTAADIGCTAAGTVIARQVRILIEFLTKRTEPSPMATLTPPGCRLRAAYLSGSAVVAPVQGGFGGWLMQ